MSASLCTLLTSLKSHVRGLTTCSTTYPAHSTMCPAPSTCVVRLSTSRLGVGVLRGHVIARLRDGWYVAVTRCFSAECSVAGPHSTSSSASSHLDSLNAFALNVYVYFCPPWQGAGRSRTVVKEVIMVKSGNGGNQREHPARLVRSREEERGMKKSTRGGGEEWSSEGDGGAGAMKAARPQEE
ncbi:hypothetical protein FB451DRAFT_1182643 [Mycena latifolia]|nr:hypothetical protein FB451DRAFT_1182643 [Mycena latifolia]